MIITGIFSLLLDTNSRLNSSPELVLFENPPIFISIGIITGPSKSFIFTTQVNSNFCGKCILSPNFEIIGTLCAILVNTAAQNNAAQKTRIR